MCLCCAGTAECKRKAVTDDKARYIVVAATCALLHNAVMIGGDTLGVHYLPAAGFSYVLVVLWGYTLHSWFTFSRPVSGSSFLLYAISMATNYPATVALIYVLRDLGGQPVAIAVPLATTLLAIWNFVASRWAITTNRNV